jgi:hypothetical protein
MFDSLQVGFHALMQRFAFTKGRLANGEWAKLNYQWAKPR